MTQAALQLLTHLCCGSCVLADDDPDLIMIMVIMMEIQCCAVHDELADAAKHCFCDSIG